MKPASLELLALLKTRTFFAADLYTFSLVGGGTLRYCSGDRDLSANGFAYSAGGETGPFFDRTDNKAKCHWKTGTAADQLVFDVLPGSSLVLGLPFLQAVNEGLFSAAEVTLERAYMPAYGDTTRGTLIYFVGRVAEVDSGRSLATFTVKSHLRLLNTVKLPRNLFQAGCVNSLGDPACGVNLSAFAVAGTVTAAPTTTSLTASALAGQIPGYFVQGKLAFTSGANAGLTRTMASYAPASGAVTFNPPLPLAPSIGDGVTALPGCDHTYNGANGCPKFANVARFRGEPFIPIPETAV